MSESKKAQVDVLVIDGYENAYMGVVINKNLNPVACYDAGKVVSICVKDDGMTIEEANDYVKFLMALMSEKENGPVFFIRDIGNDVEKFNFLMN